MIKEINGYLATGPYMALNDTHRSSAAILDVRDLVDKEGNSSELIWQKINLGLTLLTQHSKLIVCCDYGISRSNSIAAAILSLKENIPLSQAIELIFAQIGVQEIKIPTFRAVAQALQVISQQPLQNHTLFLSSEANLAKAYARNKSPNELVFFSQDLTLVESALKLDLLVREQGITTIAFLVDPTVFGTNADFGRGVKILKNLLDVALYNKIRLIYRTDASLFGGYVGELYADELTPARSITSVGDLCLCAETLIHNYREYFQLNALIVRTARVYDFTTSIQPRFLANLVEILGQQPEFVTIHAYSGQLPAIDVLALSDFVEILQLLLNNDQISGILNVGAGKLIYIQEIVQMLIAHLSPHTQIQFAQLDSPVANIALDSKKLCQLWGRPPSSFTLKQLIV